MRQVETSPRAWARLRWLGLTGLITALALCLMPGAANAAVAKGKTLNVMTRNLYLGADLTPALRANNVNDAIDAGGKIINQVYATKFPSVRAALLAKEIQKTKPDVVGLQEVAWWRTISPANVNASLTQTPTATATDPAAGDFLTSLLSQLNAGKGKKAGASAKKNTLRYKVAVVKPEFDFELPVNNGSGGLAAANRNERLTLQDVILVRQGGGIKATNPTSGTYSTLLNVKLGGFLSINVTRGWAAVDVKAHGRKFHVVDTHFEAFDSQASNTTSQGTTVGKGEIRQAQARQLVGPGGPASLPKTILVGDLNSNFPATGDQQPGDTLAFQAVLGAGFQSKQAAAPPFSCCIEDPNLTNPSTAGVTHLVDHIMSNSNKVKFRRGAVTSTFANGLWSSDHFGVFSSLLIK